MGYRNGKGWGGAGGGAAEVDGFRGVPQLVNEAQTIETRLTGNVIVYSLHQDVGNILESILISTYKNDLEDYCGRK